MSDEVVGKLKTLGIELFTGIVAEDVHIKAALARECCVAMGQAETAIINLMAKLQVAERINERLVDKYAGLADKYSDLADRIAND